MKKTSDRVVISVKAKHFKIIGAIAYICLLFFCYQRGLWAGMSRKGIENGEMWCAVYMFIVAAGTYMFSRIFLKKGMTKGIAALIIVPGIMAWVILALYGFKVVSSINADILYNIFFTASIPLMVCTASAVLMWLIFDLAMKKGDRKLAK